MIIEKRHKNVGDAFRIIHHYYYVHYAIKLVDTSRKKFFF